MAHKSLVNVRSGEQKLSCKGKGPREYEGHRDSMRISQLPPAPAMIFTGTGLPGLQKSTHQDTRTGSTSKLGERSLKNEQEGTK